MIVNPLVDHEPFSDVGIVSQNLKRVNRGKITRFQSCLFPDLIEIGLSSARRNYRDFQQFSFTCPQ